MFPFRTPWPAALALSLSLAWAAAAPAHASLLISADFGPDSATHAFHDFSGVDASAAAVDARFAAADQWNALRFDSYYNSGSGGTSPTFSNLLDSTGAATGVSFSVIGNVRAFDAQDFYSSLAVYNDPLRNDYLYFASNGLAPAIEFQFSGLAANTEYRFYAYGARIDQVRSMAMLLDTDADGLLDDEIAQYLVSGSVYSSGSSPQDAYFSVFSDANGVIRGSASNPLGQFQSNWAGFQLVEVSAQAATVPEPATWLLVLGCAGALLPLRRSPR